jgi:hypothetical protein
MGNFSYSLSNLDFDELQSKLDRLAMAAGLLGFFGPAGALVCHNGFAGGSATVAAATGVGLVASAVLGASTFFVGDVILEVLEIRAERQVSFRQNPLPDPGPGPAKILPFPQNRIYRPIL